MSKDWCAAEILARHPAWPALVRLGSDWTAPPIDSARAIAISRENTEHLEARGISLIATPGPGNRLLLDDATPRQRLRLDLAKATDCTLLLARDGTIHGDMMMHGSGHLFATAGAEGRVGTRLSCTLRGRNSLLFIGRGTSANSAKLLVDGDGQSILIGDDGMFSNGITIRSTDSHAIIDLSEKRQINRPKSVLLYSHVWVGQDVLVTKGVTVGQGAILGGRAVVTRDVPARSLVAGVPARVLREGVTWSRKANPDAEEIEAIIAKWGEPV